MSTEQCCWNVCTICLSTRYKTGNKLLVYTHYISAYLRHIFMCSIYFHGFLSAIQRLLQNDQSMAGIRDFVYSSMLFRLCIYLLAVSIQSMFSALVYTIVWCVRHFFFCFFKHLCIDFVQRATAKHIYIARNQGPAWPKSKYCIHRECMCHLRHCGNDVAEGRRT